MTRRTTSVLAAALLLAASASVSGCLDGDIRQTIYLDPGGWLTSEIVALNIRSDCADPAARLAEEQEFLEDLRSGAYEEEWFPEGADSIEATILRSERPYTVVMTAHYERVEDFFEAALEEGSDTIEAEVWLEYLGSETRLVITVWDDEADAEECSDPCEQAEEVECSDSEALDDSVQIILTEGRFVDAEGFKINGDLAIPLPDECTAAKHGVTTYSLTWTTE